MTFPSLHPYAMSSTSRDISGRPRCHECVCWARKRPLKAEANTETSAFQPLPLSEDSCFENISGESSQTEGILDLKHGCFVYSSTSRPHLTDGKWLVMNGRFVSPLTAFDILSSYICTVEHHEWSDFFKVNLEQNSTHTHAHQMAHRSAINDW